MILAVTGSTVAPVGSASRRAASFLFRSNGIGRFLTDLWIARGRVTCDPVGPEYLYLTIGLLCNLDRPCGVLYSWCRNRLGGMVRFWRHRFAGSSDLADLVPVF